MSEYILKETKIDKKWDKFIDDSLNGTIFSKSYYLNSITTNAKAFFCYKNKELRGAVIGIESENKKDLILDDLAIYGGIIYNKPTNKQNYSQQLSEHFKIQTFISEKLVTIYDNISLRLDPSIQDIRAFLWVHYGDENKPKYIPTIRYTTYLNISDFDKSKKLEDIFLYKNASVSRRQQIRYAIKKNYKTIEFNDIELFIVFYKKTMERQNIEISNFILDKMKTLMASLIKNGVGKIYASYDEKNEIGSMAFFAWDNKRAYYIFGANDPEKRNSHTGTHVLWEIFYDLNEMGIQEVDLEGVNSPKRGWFKLSFGGKIVPYYRLDLQIK